MQKLVYIFLFSLAFGVTIFAQQDTINLATDALWVEDLNKSDDVFLNQKVVSASRSLQDLQDLPFTIYVITKEEIQAKGYNTLVDALKWIPGIRVSQPGSGLEGETFIMRGLQGNTYAKILINDIPIKPFGTRGMPIGAQLPIREAERIEVIFGPAAAVYGADASAGVINIVTMESERPLFTEAEISLGTDGFSSLHILFGGKVGKGSRILRYSIFGSNTTFNNRRIFRDTASLYSPSRYAPDSSYLDNPNYSTDFNPTPHLSRLVGVRLAYKKLNFSALAMTRQDHSALGLNPTAVSYGDPNNYIRDNTVNLRFGWSPSWNKWGMKFNLDLLFYKREGTSSTRYVENNLKNLFDLAIADTATDSMQIEENTNQVYNRFFSGNRYSEVDSFEPNSEILLFFTPRKEIEFLFGFRTKVAAAELVDYTSQLSSGGLSLGNSAYTILTNSTFIQSYLNFKKIKGIASINYSISDQFDSRINPRIALLYRLNSSLGLRAFYGTSFRVPSAYYYANTFTVRKDNVLNYRIGEVNRNSIDGESVANLQPEENTTIEFGFRYHYKKFFAIDANLYYSNTDNIIAFQELARRSDDPINQPNMVDFYRTGYTNFGNSRLKVFGVQTNIISNFTLQRRDLQLKLGLNFTFGEKQLPGLFEAILQEVPEQPEFSLQAQLAIPLGEKWTIYFDNLYHGASISEAAILDIRDMGEFQRETVTIPLYYTLDVTSRWNVSKNFSSFFQVRNIFNRRYGGLSATGTPDDLFYNPQSSGTWRFGLSYSLN